MYIEENYSNNVKRPVNRSSLSSLRVNYLLIDGEDISLILMLQYLLISILFSFIICYVLYFRCIAIIL